MKGREIIHLYNIDYNFVDVLIGVILVMILTRVKMYMTGGEKFRGAKHIYLGC